MKTIEKDPRLPGWLNTVLNCWPFCIHEEATATIFTIAYDAEGLYRPENASLFYNGYFFIRIMFPFGIWVHIKPRANTRIQFGLGWKANGRMAITFRVQTDKEAATGVLGPNYGQATAWDRGAA
jgi:hypothetical protein